MFPFLSVCVILVLFGATVELALKPGFDRQELKWVSQLFIPPPAPFILKIDLFCCQFKPLNVMQYACFQGCCHRVGPRI